MSTNGLEARAPLMELRGVSKSFGAIQSLSGIDIDIRHGEVLGLLGDNGAGKSTLIKILSGVHTPDSGEVRWEGRPVRLGSPSAARRLGIETVYQNLALVDELSIARNFFLGKEPCRRLGPVRLLRRKEMLHTTQRMLDEIGISTVRSANQSVKTLSGGERQAIAIGRTMHFGAKLVILDEPTSALAVGETAKVLGYIRRAKEQGLAVVFISHSLYDVHPVCDRIVVIEHGRKIADAPASEVTVDDLARLITFKGQGSTLAPAPE